MTEKEIQEVNNTEDPITTTVDDYFEQGLDFARYYGKRFIVKQCGEMSESDTIRVAIAWAKMAQREDHYHGIGKD